MIKNVEYNLKGERFIKNSFLAECIVLPKYVKGYLDWVTGVLRLNCTLDEYDQVLNGDNPEFDIYWETIVHETIHFFQIVSSGFLYKYVTEIGWLFLSDKRFLGDIVKLLYEISNNKFTISKIYEIYEKRHNGLAVIDLVEGHAFYCHKRALNKFNRKTETETVYKPYKGTVYHKAYDYLYNIIGENAYFMFSQIVFLSLCFTNPVSTYVRLCDGLKSHNFNINAHSAQTVFVELIDSVYSESFDKYESKILSSPLEEQLKDNKLFNPFYTPIIKQLSGYEDFSDISHYLRNPYEFRSDIFLAAMRPVLFNDASMLIPKKLDKGIFTNKNMHEDILKSRAILSFNIFTNKNAGLNFFWNTNDE